MSKYLLLVILLFMVIRCYAPQPQIRHPFPVPKIAHSNWITGSTWIKRFAATAELDPPPIDLSISTNLTRETERHSKSPSSEQRVVSSVTPTVLKVTEPQSRSTVRVLPGNTPAVIQGIKAGSSRQQKSKNSPVKQSSCTACGKAFKSATGFGIHWAQFHGNGSSLHECNLCDKKFAQRFQLGRHVRAHTGERPYTCVQCNRSFSESSKLARHSLIHTSEKPFQCDLCYKTFKRAANCRQHYQAKHSLERPFVCIWCNRAFGLKKYLNKHLKFCKFVNTTTTPSTDQNSMA